MKLGISLICLALAGCAMEPATPYQRELALRQMRPAYQLPRPTPLSVPQTRLITCMRADGTTYTCQ